MAGAWIFQGNPKYYDVVGAVRVLPRIEWWVRQYKRRIEAGDTAYIWETGGAGFVARAVVSGEPALGYDDDEEEDPFRRSPRDLGPRALRAAGDHRGVRPADLAGRMPCRSHLEDAPQSGVPERHQLPGHARTRGRHQRRAGRAHEVAHETAAPTDGSIPPRRSRPPDARCASHGAERPVRSRGCETSRRGSEAGPKSE